MASQNYPIDRRFGGEDRCYAYPPKDIDMRVPDQISNTVLFLGVLTGEGEKYLGTGFIVAVAYGPGHVFEFVDGAATTRIRVPFAFLVTARHIVEDLEGSDFHVRANAKDGSVKVITFPYDTKWWYHPTEKDAVDVAVTFSPPESLYQLDFKPIPVTMFVGDEAIAELNLGLATRYSLLGCSQKSWGKIGTFLSFGRGRLP